MSKLEKAWDNSNVSLEVTSIMIEGDIVPTEVKGLSGVKYFHLEGLLREELDLIKDYVKVDDESMESGLAWLENMANFFAECSELCYEELETINAR